MPTDPFVAPDLDDRPRQQQNLPPGLGYPPAKGWRADRPGDLSGVAATAGRTLRGTPGPNVGYGYTLTERAHDRFQLAAHEDLHDAMSVVAEIGMKRASAFGRAPVMADIDLAMALLGYDGSADAAFAAWRAQAVHEAGHSYLARRAIVDSVPESTLAKKVADLGPDVATWRTAVQAPVA